MNSFKRAELAAKIAEEYQLPVSVIYEALAQENELKNPLFDKWNYELTKRYGKHINNLWDKLNGAYITKDGSAIKSASLIQIISEKVDLRPYEIASILKNTHAKKGASWDVWINEQIQNYGPVISSLWENRKHKVKDNWSLCAVIESISKDTGNIVNPYVVLQILANKKKVDLNINTAHTIYSDYKNAKLALDIINKDGPKTAQEIADELEITKRVAVYSLKRLQEKELVKVHIDRQYEFYYYLPDQQAQLEEKATYLRIEKSITNSGRQYITCPELMSIGNLPGTTAIRLLQRWIKEGKLIEINKHKNPKIYEIIK